MALDLLKIRTTSSQHKNEVYISNEFVPASYVVARLAEDCLPWLCDEWQGITLDEATYEADQGLLIVVQGKKYRLEVTAVEIGD
jgi:hypothetical protein